MVKLIQISKEELPELVYFSYEGDFDLLEKFHLEKYTLEEAVLKTLELVNEHDEQVYLSYKKIIFNNKTIGYTIITGEFLYSFCIRKEFRTEEVKNGWFELLIKECGKNMKIGLMSNNTRAINFFKKRGYSITWVNPENNKVNEVLLTIN